MTFEWDQDLSLGELWSYMSTSEFPEEEKLFFHHFTVTSGEEDILMWTGRCYRNYYLLFKLEQLEVKTSTKAQICMKLLAVCYSFLLENFKKIWWPIPCCICILGTLIIVMEGKDGQWHLSIWKKNLCTHILCQKEMALTAHWTLLCCCFEERWKLLQGDVLLSAPGLIASQQKNSWCYFSRWRKSYLVSSHQLRLDLHESLCFTFWLQKDGLHMVGHFKHLNGPFLIRQ